LGVIHTETKNFAESIEYFSKALDIAIKIKDLDGEKKFNVCLHNLYYTKNEQDKAIPYAKRLLTIAEENMHIEEIIKYSFSLGLSYFNTFDYTKSRNFFERCLEICVNHKTYSTSNINKDFDYMRHCILLLATVNNNLHEYQQAIEYGKLAISYKWDDLSLLGSCYLQLGIANKVVYKYDIAKNYINKAIDIKTKISDERGLAECYSNLSLIYSNTFDYPKARHFLKKGQSLATKVNDLYTQSNIYSNLAEVCMKLSEYQQAIEYGKLAVSIKKNINDNIGEAIYHSRLGNFYSQIHDFTKARIEYQEAITIATKYNDKKVKLHSMFNLSETYYGIPEKQISLINQCIELAQEIKDNSALARCLFSCGKFYYMVNQFSKTIEFVSRSISIAEKIEDKICLAAAYALIGLTYLSSNDNNLSITNLEKAITISTQIENKDLLCLSLSYLGLLFFQLGNYDLSYHFLEKAIVINEEIGLNIIDNEFKIQFSGIRVNLYNLIITVCVKLKKIDKAFEFTNRNKSKALIDLLTTSNIHPKCRNTSEISDMLEKEEYLLLFRKNIQTRFTKIKLNIQSDPESHLTMELDDLKSELNSLYEKLEVIDPEYVELRRGGSFTFANAVSLL
jgi:tetratricopeptide (TPR) repeat protein